jgi:hypothetical protein
MEAVLSTVDIRIADLRLSTLRLIGRHARDVLGNYVGACQSVKLAIDLVFERALPSLIPEIDPWFPGLEQMDIKSVDRDDLAWFDGSPLIDIAIGGAIVSLREAVRQPDEKSVANLDSDVLQRAIAKGGAEALERAVKSITRKSKDIRTSLKSERLATSSD